MFKLPSGVSWRLNRKPKSKKVQRGGYSVACREDKQRGEPGNAAAISQNRRRDMKSRGLEGRERHRLRGEPRAKRRGTIKGCRWEEVGV